MRPVLICAVMTVCLVCSMVATASRPVPSGLTVVMDFRGAHSDNSIREMETESATILKSTGLKLDWKLRNQMVVGDTYPDVVVMTFKGACTFDPVPRIYDELGPLASTKTTDNEIQPFGQVDCDHVVNSARSAMFGGDFSRADTLLGRALGRVVVHELVHMLTHSAQHGKDGVFEAGLTGKQLISPTLPLSALDINRLQFPR
jgi:hypothetical protein